MQKEKFKQLYDYCQTLTPKVSRNKIEPAAVELSGKEVKVVKSGLDVNHCRGLFFSATNPNTHLVRQCGNRNVIVIARDLNYCWERIVYTKELMHLFDDEDDMTSTPEALAGLLAGLSGTTSPPSRSQQATSDALGIWMALACLCPEQYRQEFAEQRSKGHIDDYAVALRLRIPQLYVPSLLSPDFPKLISMILEV